MNATTKRDRQERNEIVPGDEILLKLADFAGTWRIDTVADTGWDLIRDEPYLILSETRGRVFASDVVYVSKLG